MIDATKRPAAFQKCGQSMHKGTDAYILLTTDEATIQWHKGNVNYNFASGRSNSATSAVKSSAYQFTQMVWKGKAMKKVGFGIKDKLTVAWYCPTGNSPDTAQDFKDNVCEAGCPKWCVTDTVNKCYNEKQIAKHNELRDRHGSKGLVFDHDIAKAA